MSTVAASGEGATAGRRVFRNTAVLVVLRVVVPALSLPVVLLLSVRNPIPFRSKGAIMGLLFINTV